MARTVENRLFIGGFGDSSKPVIAIGRYLLADANHASEERAHGWLVVDATDPKALGAMADLALKFAEACENRAGALAAKPAKAAKAIKAPTPPKAPEVKRAAAVTTARAATPRVVAPTPTPAPAKAATGLDDLSWMDAVRA
jgi:hypothetical protein